MEIKIIGTSPEEIERRANLSNPSDDFWFTDNSRKTHTGEAVTETTALRYSAFYAAVRIRSQAISTVPLILYKRVGNNKERATDHPLFPLLHNSPNDVHTSQEWLELVSVHMDMQGNAYTFIIRNNRGQVTQLIPVHPSRVRIDNITRRESGVEITERVYFVEGDDRPWSMSETLHFKDLSIDGVMGISKIKAAREAIAYGLGLEAYGGRFFANDASSGLVITHPENIGKIAYEQLSTIFEQKRLGINKHRVAVLGEGAKVEKITISPEDAQFLKSRQFSIQEISRFMGVPPHMLSDLSKSSFNNIEEESLSFLHNTLRPAFVRIEQKINKVLLGNDPKFFVEFLFDARQRADLAARSEAYSKALAAGWMTANEIRAFENLPQVEGGNDLRAPLNTAPVEKRVTELEYIVLRNQIDRVQESLDDAERKNAIELDKAIQRTSIEVRVDPSGFDSKSDFLKECIPTVLEDGTAEDQDQAVAICNSMWENRSVRQLPATVSLRDAFRDDFKETAIKILDERTHLEDDEYKVAARTYLGYLYHEFAEGIVSYIEEETGRGSPNLDPFVDKLIDSAANRWINESTSDIKLFIADESVKVQNAITRRALSAQGVKGFVWRLGNNCARCADCLDLDGYVVSGKEVFAQSGQMTPDGFQVEHNISHAPLHSGCDCTVEAAQGEQE